MRGNYVKKFINNLKKNVENNRFLKLNNFHFKLIDDLGNYVNEDENSF